MKITRRFILASTERVYVLVGIHWVQITKLDAVKLIRRQGIVAEIDTEPDDVEVHWKPNLYLFYDQDELKITNLERYYRVRNKVETRESKSRRIATGDQNVYQCVKN